MKVSSRDYTLIKRAIYLEKFLMDRVKISPELDKMIEEAIMEYQNVKSIENSIESNQHRFNQFSADNAVALVSCAGPPFKISHISGNYKTFFGCKESQIVGTVLENYMPDIIARNHNRYMLDFLQGSECQTKLRYLSTSIKRQSRLSITRRRIFECLHHTKVRVPDIRGPLYRSYVR